MTLPPSQLKILGDVIWFRHFNDPKLVDKFDRFPPGTEVTLETDGVVGRWQRMKTGRDGRATPGLRPVGAMKSIWAEWYKTRKGETIDVREVSLADDYLAAASALFSEWASPEDEAAFRDL